MDKRLDLGHFDLAVAIVVDCLEDAAVEVLDFGQRQSSVAIGRPRLRTSCA
jgi:hypothetical protein